MGLDWCVRDKEIPDKKENLLFADAHIKRLRNEHDEAWASFLDGRESPSFFPNPLSEEFSETDVAKELGEKIKEWEFVRSACVVSPLETLGAPMVGESPEADKHVRDYYKEISGLPERDDRKKFLSRFPTEEDYLEHCTGMRVSELAKNKEGFGSVTGIAAGPESFRGKCLNYIEWLDDDLRNEAYDNHDPKALASYGERLKEAARTFKEIATKNGELLDAKPEDPYEDSIEDQIKIVEDAGSWCEFWGKAGHGMHAWY